MEARSERPGEIEDRVLPDLSTFLIGGRVADPSEAIQQGVDAEQLGLRRAFISERYDIKDAGPLLGAVAARTTRLELGTGILVTGSRHPVMTASFAGTMQVAFGQRFILGLGRAQDRYMAKVYSMRAHSFEAYADYVDILRRLWTGETVSYDGPAGRYESMMLADPPQCDMPPIWSGLHGGPRACGALAPISDGLLLLDLLTPEATSNAVRMIRDARERAGVDPDTVRIAQCVVSCPDFDDEATVNQTSARLLTYMVGFPQVRKTYSLVNGWDEEILKKVCDHPLFTTMRRPNADQSFYRHELVRVAELIPASWIRDSCAVGTVSDCVEKFQDFKDAGADEIVLYGSSPSENAALVGAWREHTTEEGKT